MITFVINPLSADRQCYSSDDVEDVLKNVVECIQYIQPAIKLERMLLRYDRCLESRQLRDNEDFKSSISSVSDRDIRNRWYSFSRNQPVNIEPEAEISLTIRSTKSIGLIVTGTVNLAWLAQDTHLISFGRKPLHEESQLTIEYEGQAPFVLNNAYNPDTLKRHLPLYEPNPKHKSKPYRRPGGEYVSPMSLNDTEAQNLLLVSLQHDKECWAYHGTTCKYYRFLRTYTDRNIYHGFEVEEKDVPNEIADLL